MRFRLGFKILIIGTIVAGSIWGINSYMKSRGGALVVIKEAKDAVSSDAPAPVTSVTVKAEPKVAAGKLGSAGNPLKVSIVSFHGYGPALIANGGSLKTTGGSIYDKLGASIEFVIQDDVPAIAEVFNSKAASCVWRTADFWAQEHPNLRNAKLDAKAVMIVDNTQGGDAVIARDPNIKSIEDLAGKQVALLQFTPSHGLLLNAIDNSSMTGKAKSSVKPVFINVAEGTGGVRAAFESKAVDAAVLWDPDLSLALRSGGHVVYSSKNATNLIFDVMVCDSRVLKDPDGAAAVQKFVRGWMNGVVAARNNPDAVADALIATEDMFKQLAAKEGKPFIKSLFNNLVWTDLADNARILGLAGGTNHYERVYSTFDPIYRAAGALANPASPVIAASDSFDYRFIKAMLDENQAAKVAAAAPEAKFDEAGAARAATTVSALTKPVDIKFATGSAELTKASQAVIDKQLAPFIETMGKSYIELSGNTDSTGSAAVNKTLSLRRAQAVRDYLVKEWDVQPARLIVVGNGSAAPICVEGTGTPTEECRAMNRATRVAIKG